MFRKKAKDDVQLKFEFIVTVRMPLDPP
jgi:hypothetical protein